MIHRSRSAPPDAPLADRLPPASLAPLFVAGHDTLGAVPTTTLPRCAVPDCRCGNVELPLRWEWRSGPSYGTWDDYLRYVARYDAPRTVAVRDLRTGEIVNADTLTLPSAGAV